MNKYYIAIVIISILVAVVWVIFSTRNVHDIHVSTRFMIKENETKQLVLSDGSSLSMTLDKIEIPLTNVPGNRNNYYFTFSSASSREVFRYDPFNGQKVYSYFGFNFYFTEYKDETIEVVVLNTDILPNP